MLDSEWEVPAPCTGWKCIPMRDALQDLASVIYDAGDPAVLSGSGYRAVTLLRCTRSHSLVLERVGILFLLVLSVGLIPPGGRSRSKDRPNSIRADTLVGWLWSCF